MAKRLERTADRFMHITIALTTAGCRLRAQLTPDAKARVGSLPDIDVAKIRFGEMTADERGHVMARARWKARDNTLETDIPPACRILNVSSGKGRVGKSTVTANLAVLLADRGYTVGAVFDRQLETPERWPLDPDHVQAQSEWVLRTPTATQEISLGDVELGGRPRSGGWAEFPHDNTN